MADRAGNFWLRGALPLSLALAGCDPFHNQGCSCTTEIRINVCPQGKYDGLASVSYRRERGNGKLDTLYRDNEHCFNELAGKQRILVYRDEVRIDSSVWFTQRTVDCCHEEGKVVVF